MLAAFETPSGEPADEDWEPNLNAAPVPAMGVAPVLGLLAFLETIPMPAAETAPVAVAALDKAVAALDKNVPQAFAGAEPPPIATPPAFELEVEPMAQPAEGARPDPGPGTPATLRPEPVPLAGEKEPALGLATPPARKNAGREAETPPEAEAPEPAKEPGRTAEAFPELRSTAAGPEIPAASVPKQRSEALRAEELLPPPEPPRAATPPRVTVRLEPREGVAAPPVEVVVAQRGPALHLSVHSADGRLGAEMRSSIGDLTERLETLGFRASPVALAERNLEIRESLPSERSWSESGYSSGSGFADGEKRQGRRDRNQWKQEMEKHRAT